MPPSSRPLTSFVAVARATRAAAHPLPRRPPTGAFLARSYHSPLVVTARYGSQSHQLPLSPPAIARRTYSTDKSPPSSAPSKIWGFEEIQDLTETPAGDRNVTIIDVREPSELQHTGRIPGAINIPVTSNPDSFHIAAEEFEDRFGFPRPAADGEAVFYCKAGVRSRAAAGLARDAGWKRVGEYPGSWVDWERRGGKVER